MERANSLSGDAPFSRPARLSWPGLERRRPRPPITNFLPRRRPISIACFASTASNGEVGACQYGLKEGAAIGVTLCYPPGEGARAGAFSEYALVASRHTGEGGVFRVDLRSGMMSICFVLNETAVVCTPPAK